MNINLDMVLAIQTILCVHAELKLKPLNIFSRVVIFTVLKGITFNNFEKIDRNFQSLSAKNQVYVLLHGSQTNHETLEIVVPYLTTIRRFLGLLINF